MNETITKLLIVQGLQLPIVALLCFFTFNSTIVNGVNQENFHFWGSIHGKINKKHPLRFIAFGFLFNLFYLICGLFANYNRVVPLPEWLKPDYLKSAIYILSILTTYFFFLQASSQLYFSNNKNGAVLNSKERWHYWIAIKYLALTSLAVIIGYTLEPTSYLFSFFEFSGSLIAGLYLYKLTSIHNDSLQKKYSRYLIPVGWSIWTILQFWPHIIGKHLDENQIELSGYSLSLVAKTLVLLGLYNISLTIGRHALKRLSEKNKELKKTVESINSLQGLINYVSNVNSLERLFSRVVDHLTNKEVFDFDYAIISEVNYLQQKIIYRASKAENPYIKQIERWVRNEGISFDNHDIMAQVVRGGEVIHANREELNGQSIDIRSETSPLDRDIYIKYNHENLNRFYIPVLNLTESQIDGNRVVAVIEAGYYIRAAELNSDNYKPKTEIIKRGELNIYLDNYAQTYERLFHQYVIEEVGSLIKKCEDSSKDNHITYLRDILTATCRLVNAEFGFIAIIPINKPSQDTICIFGKDNISDKEKTLKETFIECIEKNIDSDDLFKIDECNFAQRAHKLFNTNSLQLNEFNINGLTAGCLVVFAKKPNHFNGIVQFIIRNITEKIGIIYNEKKFHNAVSSLVTPDNAITDLEINIQPLIDILTSYFETPYISIWLKETRENKEYYIQKFASNELKSGCKKFGINELPIDSINLEYEHKPIKLDINGTDVENSSFREFGRRNNVKMLLRKPLKAHHQFFGFINIYFSKSIDNLVYEAENFLNLIAVKALITIQLHNLVSTFRQISDSFTQNDLNITLQTITDSAMNLLNADPVILFKSNNGEDVFCNDVMYSHKIDFKEKEIIELFRKERESHVELAEYIIKDKSVFLNNKAEYNDYIRKHPKVHNKRHFEKDFWDREKIQSLAAVRLVHRTKNYVKPVGVMFINFRNEVTFNDETIRLIKTFASFAAGSIYNGLLFEQNRHFLLSNLRLTQPLLEEALNAGAMHDIVKTFEAIHYCYNRLVEKINNSQRKRMDGATIGDELRKLKGPFGELKDHITKIASLYKPSEEPNIKREINIVKILEAQLELMETELRQKNINVVKEFANNDVRADCDDGQIGLAILNILKNAYQAMGKRGTLTLRLNKIENTNEVKIEIIDNGKGISDDIKDFIFEPNFSYDKPGGSGLGLSMSKYVIQTNHLGLIKAKTKDGKTTFTIILPITHSKPSQITDI